MNHKDLEELNEGLEKSETDFKLPFFKRMLIKLSPRLFMKLSARELDLNTDFMKNAERLFAGKKIHIDPLHGENGRGFIICIDGRLTLWFFQDGDSFRYDGFEMGLYDDGDVTVFDNLPE